MLWDICASVYQECNLCLPGVRMCMRHKQLVHRHMTYQSTLVCCVLQTHTSSTVHKQFQAASSSTAQHNIHGPPGRQQHNTTLAIPSCDTYSACAAPHVSKRCSKAVPSAVHQVCTHQRNAARAALVAVHQHTPSREQCVSYPCMHLQRQKIGMDSAVQCCAVQHQINTVIAAVAAAVCAVVAGSCLGDLPPGSSGPRLPLLRHGWVRKASQMALLMHHKTAAPVVCTFVCARVCVCVWVCAHIGACLCSCSCRMDNTRWS